MKRLLLVFVTVVFTSCSFDNKTGIWKDASNTPLENQSGRLIEENKPGTRYEDIFTKKKPFNDEINPSNFSKVETDTPIKIAYWLEQYAISTNNISNFSYNNNKKLIFKSRKLSKELSKETILEKKVVFYKDNLISHDHKGTIFIYSLILNKKIFEYNFYKKKFKNINKEINLIINKNFLYAADNLGYIYALNLDDNSTIWAKNYGIPFRSNLKFSNDQIFVANQDNVVYSIDSKTGDKKWEFATSLTFLKSDFENNFALDIVNNDLLFLNTSGELYSIDYLLQKINWVLNFKTSSLSGDTELFSSQPLVIKNNDVIVITEKAVLSYNISNGLRNWNFIAEPIFKPIATLNRTYVILKNNLLICLDNTTGDVIWSKNIFSNVGEKKVKKKYGITVDFKIVNNEIHLYSNNGYLLSFNIVDGNLNYSRRINKSGISSKIIFLNNNMLFIDSKNKLLKFN
jgi:outer membrane protein assembly factor BamB